MLSILGQRYQFCDQVSRRGFLGIGGLAVAGYGCLTLADTMRLQAATGTSVNSQKAVINVFLGGGPPHQDMWDIKVDAPKEIRGEFQPITTKVPGIEIGEVFTRIAEQMDKFVAIRSVVGCVDNHDAYQCFSGWHRNADRSIGGRPSIGAVASRQASKPRVASRRDARNLTKL